VSPAFLCFLPPTVPSRVAVGETVAEDAEDGVDTVLRLQSEVCDEQVRVHWQPTGAKHHNDCQEHSPRVRRAPVLLPLQPPPARSILTCTKHHP